MGEGVSSWGHTNCESPGSRLVGVTLQESSPLRGGFTPHCRVGPTFRGWETGSAQQLPPPHPPAQAPRPQRLPVHGQPVPFGPAKPSEHLKSPPGACVWGPAIHPPAPGRQPSHAHLLAQVPASPPPASSPSSHRPQADGTLKEVSDPLQEYQGVVSFLTDTH